MEQSEIPKSWVECAISKVFDVNPGHRSIEIHDEDQVTFLPMTLIAEEQNSIDTSDTRPYKKVKTGFTKFIEGDVLFAKITPCMENGKIAIANNLKNGIGCGTTELYVFRSKCGINNKYLYYYILQREYRAHCKSYFNGAVGQQRVPKSVFDEKKFPLPPLAEQQRIVAKLDSLFARIERIYARWDNFDILIRSFVESSLVDPTTKQYFRREKLLSYIEEGTERIGDDWHGKRKVGISAKKGIIDLDAGQKSTFEKYKIVRPGDFVYNAMRVNIGSIGIYDGIEIAITSPDYIVFRYPPGELHLVREKTSVILGQVLACVVGWRDSRV